MEARGGIEPPMMVLQTIALPLGDRATERNEIRSGEGRREKEAFAAQSPALHYKPLPLASINSSKFHDYLRYLASRAWLQWARSILRPLMAEKEMTIECHRRA
jgi:hypothetical protein